MSAVEIDKADEFRDHKAAVVKAAEAALAKAEERHARAMEEYEREVERHQERGDGFFPAEYHAKRAEAVRAAKWLRTKRSAPATARAEAAATTLGGVRREWAETSARIDKAHADYPQCPCGQRALTLDKFGLCSKVDVRHQERRGVYSAPKSKARAR